VHLVLALALALSVTCGCRRGRHGGAGDASPESRPHVVVGTSMIESIVRGLAGDALEVHRLAPPGQCPGHFDMKPADLEAVARSRLLLRHDYQGHLDAKLREVCGGRQIVSLPTTGPQTIPRHYLALCRAVKDALVAAFPGLSQELDANFGRLQAKVAAAAQEAQRLAVPLRGRVVVVSSFQAEFCEWLGLKVAAQFDLEQEMSPRDLERAIGAGRRAGARAVVCNLQRGEREGKAIAQRLGVPVVVLSNYPLEPRSEDAYRRLLLGNVRRLLDALGAAGD